MLTDSQYIMSSFKKNFSRCKERKIVLYGKGPFTKLILDIFKDFNIIGIMDRDIKNGFIYGKPVVSYKEILELQVDIIIVVSRPDSIKMVFERIYSFCDVNHIQLYGINGENLFYKFKSSRSAEEDIINIFERNFSSCKNKKIVLYGKGPRTKIIVENFPEYNIIGLMDKTEKEGWYYGKPILSYDDILEHGADLIISVTRSWTTQYVYNRIGKFCIFNHVSLYDICGNNLFETMGEITDDVEPNTYFDVNEDTLKEEIQKHDVISFDVFDTLIMRKTLRPSDVFEIVENKANKIGIKIEKFHLIRKMAETNNPKHNYNIYDIYKIVQELSGITNKEAETLLNLEVEVEKHVLIRREKMVEILEYAINLGKRVYLISDMYLTTLLLEQILENLNIKGYEKIFVSCDCELCKWDGLFARFKSEIPGESYLHIGDHQVADSYCAQQQGLDAFAILKASDMLEISSYASIKSYLTNVNERSLVGLFIAKAFNNPFSMYQTSGRLEIDKVYDLGYLYTGPLISSFMIWMINELKTNKYDDILFAARDGYLIKKLYDKAIGCLKIELPQGIYFQISREVALKATVMNEVDLEWLCILPYKENLRTVFQKKFKLSDDEIAIFDETKYKSVVSYGLAHKDIIFKKSRQIREHYLEYIESLGLKTQKKYAFFDLVASGTCQDSLVRILPFELVGLYLCNYDNPSGKGKDLYIKGMITEHRNVQDNSYASYLKDSYIYSNYEELNYQYKNYIFLETVLTSLDPSLSDVEAGGKLIYGEDKRSSSELEFVENMHHGIEEYFMDFISQLYVDTEEINPKIGDTLYSFKDIKYTNEHCKILDEFGLIDDLGLGTFPILRH